MTCAAHHEPAEAVLQALALCLSPDGAALRSGEAALASLAKSEQSFPAVLLRIALATDAPSGQRQIISLKSYIDSNWSSRSDNFVGPEPPEQIKAWVREHAIEGLAVPLASIRVAIAYVVSKIAHIDWPEAWPQLFDQLMACLRSGSIERVHGAMRVLSEFVRDDLSDQQFPTVAPVLLPELFSIFSSNGTSPGRIAFPPRVRARAVAVFHDFVEMMFMVKEQSPEVVSAYLDPVLSTWIQGFREVLIQELTPDTLTIKNEVLRTVVKIVRAFPKQLSPYLLPLTELVWNDLVRLSDHYEAEYILPTTDEFSGDEHNVVDSDGDLIGLETSLLSLFEFVQLAARKRSLRPLFIGNGNNATGTATSDPPFLWKFIRLALGYMRISAEMELSWKRDMNQFIQDDEEDSLGFNVRIAIEGILSVLVDTYRVDALRAICDCTNQLFQQSRNERESGHRTWWKSTEAALLALGRVESELVEAVRAHKIQYDLEGVFHHIVLDALRAFDTPFLQGRALWFASQFAEVLPRALVSEYLGGAVEAVRQDAVDPAVRVCALKAICRFESVIPREELAAVQGRILEGILHLAPSATDAALALLMETLVISIKSNPATASQYVQPISALVLDVWTRSANDFVMIDALQDIFAVMSKSSRGGFQQAVFPHLVSAIDTANLEHAADMVSSALLFAETILRAVPDPFPTVYTTELFPRIIQVVLSSEDTALLQNGEGAIKQLVRRDLPSIARWTDQHGAQTGFQHVIQFIAKLLSPTVSESGAMYVGDLITKLIQRGGDCLAPVLPDLLRAVLVRLSTAKMPTFVQTLILVYAHLIQTHTDMVVSFLATQCIDGRDGLTILVSAWVDQFQDFHGVYVMKVSCTAMCRLFAYRDTRLDHVVVRGDLVVDDGDVQRDGGGLHVTGSSASASASVKIKTRSMSKKQPDTYRRERFGVRALQLLVREAAHQSTGASIGHAGGAGAAIANAMGAALNETDDDDEVTFDDDDDDGDDEWEDDGDDDVIGGLGLSTGPSQLNDYLYGNSELMGGEDEDDVWEEDARQDPVYHVQLKDFIAQTIRDVAVASPDRFQELTSGLDEADRRRLRVLIGP